MTLARLPWEISFLGLLLKLDGYRRWNGLLVLVWLDHIAYQTAAIGKGQSVIGLLTELKRRRNHGKKSGNAISTD